MNLGEVKDVVRGVLGVPNMIPSLLDYIVGAGRRELEQRGNWYWMERDTSFNILTGISTYTLSTVLTTAAYKDTECVIWKDFGAVDTSYEEIEFRPKAKLEQNYLVSTTGRPETMDERAGILTVFPTPDLDYNAKIYYWVWTANPADDLQTDELLTRWPDAIVYASVFRGHIILNKGADYAAPWEKELAKEIATLNMFMSRRKQRGDFRFLPVGPILGPTKQPIMRRFRQLWY